MRPHSRQIVPVALALAVIASSTVPASAQRLPRAPDEASEMAPPRRYAPRGSSAYDVRPGYRGVITATTPNADGNLGGPSMGGSGGSR